MQEITELKRLESRAARGALFILFGASHCSICKSLRPRIMAMLKTHFPDMHAVYINCERSPEICAQYRVFSLPVVKAYIDGLIVVEESGAFGIKHLVRTLERPYAMWKTAQPSNRNHHQANRCNSQ